MRAHSKSVIPLELRRKVSPGLMMFVDERRAFTALGIVLALFGLYGPPVNQTDHNGFLYLLAPWIVPGAFTFLWSSIPHRPYRGQVYVSRIREVDAKDPAVVRLVELYKSDEAKNHMWCESLKLSTVLFAFLGGWRTG